MSETEKETAKGRQPPSWILKLVTRMHVFLHRASGGRMFNTLGGDEVCFVDMTGAKSGRLLTIPLMYIPYEKGLVLVASLGGAPKNPVWFYNIKKNPDIEVTHRGQRWKLHARLASSEEKAVIWPIADSHYAPFADYRKRTSRDIPIFICEPAEA
ncbi:MAG: nitroreductase family deazaflavin-dependent oxidoreductase [Deltaproteobacteria bacterium]